MSTEAPPLNMLIAYPYVNQVNLDLLLELERGAGVCWLLDSGAFTAWKLGKPIALADYCAFLANLPIQPWRYFALDVIGDAEATWRNYQAMLDRGLRPIPVFTRGESLARLDQFYETSDVVAIGGLVSQVSDPRPYLKHLHAHLAGRKYHLLGFSHLDWLKYLRPYSVDSSSWRASQRYGRMTLYLGRGRMREVRYPEVGKLLRDDGLCSRIRQLGFDPAELRLREAWWGSRNLNFWISAASWIWLSYDMEKQLGTKLFLSQSGSGAPFSDLLRRVHIAAGFASKGEAHERSAAE